MHKCIQEETIKDLEKENNKLKLQYNTSLILLTNMKNTIDRIEKNQRTVLKLLVTGLVSLALTLIKSLIV